MGWFFCSFLTFMEQLVKYWPILYAKLANKVNVPVILVLLHLQLFECLTGKEYSTTVYQQVYFNAALYPLLLYIGYQCQHHTSFW